MQTLEVTIKNRYSKQPVIVPPMFLSGVGGRTDFYESFLMPVNPEIALPQNCEFLILHINIKLPPYLNPIHHSIKSHYLSYAR